MTLNMGVRTSGRSRKSRRRYRANETRVVRVYRVIASVPRDCIIRWNKKKKKMKRKETIPGTRRCFRVNSCKFTNRDNDWVMNTKREQRGVKCTLFVWRLGERFFRRQFLYYASWISDYDRTAWFSLIVSSSIENQPFSTLYLSSLEFIESIDLEIEEDPNCKNLGARYSMKLSTERFCVSRNRGLREKKFFNSKRSCIEF